MRGPTITSGYGKDINWREGLEDAVLLCTGRPTISSAAKLPASSDVAPILAKGAGSGAEVADRLFGGPPECWQPQPKKEVRDIVPSGSFESSYDQQAMAKSFGGQPCTSADADAGSFSWIKGEADEGMGCVDHPIQHKTSSTRDCAPKGKEKRKVGRPIMHKGDPDDPRLSEKERRRIKRRIANRESARRVRSRRQEELEEMQLKMEEVDDKNMQLRTKVEESLTQRNLLAREVEGVRARLAYLLGDNQKMAAEIEALRQSLQVRMCALESELDEREAAVSGTTSAAVAGARSTQPGAEPQPEQEPHPFAFLLSPAASMEPKNSGGLELLPSMNLDAGKAADCLPLFTLDCLLDPSNHPSSS